MIKPPRLHVEEVIVEALVAGGVWFRAVRTVPEKAECSKSSFNRVVARDEFTLDANWICGKGKAGGSDAAGRSLARAVRHQAILRIRLLQEIIKSKTLERLKLIVRE